MAGFPRRGASPMLVASLAALVSFGLAFPAGAQVVVPPGPSVTVTGTGEATAVAESASVQLLIGQGGRQFGFASDGSGGSSFSSGSEAVISPDGRFDVTLEAEATPETSTDTAMTEEAAEIEAEVGDEADAGRRGRRERPERPEPRPIDETRLAPVIAAIAASGGVAPEAVRIDLSPLATEPFGNRRESARLDFEVDQPEPDALAALIAAASDAAAADGMVIQVAGVQYNPADCAAVEQEAAAAALADTEEQAGVLAELLGVELGGVVAVSTSPYFGLDPEISGCSGQQSAFFDSAYGGLGITLPVFDPSGEAEVEVYAVLTVSYGIAGA